MLRVHSTNLEWDGLWVSGGDWNKRQSAEIHKFMLYHNMLLNLRKHTETNVYNHVTQYFQSNINLVINL